jgi:hypothetical protein
MVTKPQKIGRIFQLIAWVFVIIFAIVLPFVIVLPGGFLAYPLFTLVSAPACYFMYLLACRQSCKTLTPLCECNNKKTEKKETV